jgi:signal peptidase I
MGISTWKLFKKMGYNPLFAFVPFYNYAAILKQTEHPKWWAVMSYLPIVGPIMMSVFHLFLMSKFGKKSFLERLLTVVFPFVYMAFVNYGKPEIFEEKKEFLLPGETSEKKKETFVGSITFAVVFATIIHVFMIQPFGIPTGSMERTLLVGDFLFVNKWSYGYRMPMRPLALPFLQGTIKDTGEKGNPKDDPKSYIEAVKLPYFRIPGWDEIKRNDIVVFNYPQDSVHKAIDRKDPYVKRCVAISGDVVELRAGKLFVNGKPEKILGDQEKQHGYLVETTQMLDVYELFDKYGFLPVRESQAGNGYVYHFQGLTDKTAKEIKEIPIVKSVEQIIENQGESDIAYYPVKENGIQVYDEHHQPVYSTKVDTTNTIFPFGKKWNPDWYGPLKVPKKGDVVAINKETLPEYRWIISEYEHNHLEEKDGKIFINGKATDQYTIKQNYFMMIGDNRDASLDARFFGFVPEENIIGKPMFTWMSLQGAFGDEFSMYQPKFKVRWNRMFKATNTGEAHKTSYWWIAVLILVLFFGWESITKPFRKKKKNEES